MISYTLVSPASSLRFVRLGSRRRETLNQVRCAFPHSPLPHNLLTFYGIFFHLEGRTEDSRQDCLKQHVTQSRESIKWDTFWWNFLWTDKQTSIYNPSVANADTSPNPTDATQPLVIKYLKVTNIFVSVSYAIEMNTHGTAFNCRKIQVGAKSALTEGRPLDP